MAKCDICKKAIQTTFLKKLVGTNIKVKGKNKTVCSDCQKKLKTKEEILKHLK